MVILLIIMLVLFSALELHADIYKYVSDDGTVLFTNTPMDKGGKIIVKEKISYQKPDKGYGKSYTDGERLQNITEKKAKQYNIDPKLVKAVIKAESNWNPNAVSPKGALGLMQLMPSTASIMGVSNPFNPEENIDGGIRYLKYLLNKFSGNLTLALAAYNAGPKLVERIKTVPSIPETVMYVNRVINYYSSNNFAQVQGVPRGGRHTKIQKMVLKDGTVLFTNSYLSNLYFDQGF